MFQSALELESSDLEKRWAKMFAADPFTSQITSKMSSAFTLCSKVVKKKLKQCLFPD